MKTILIVDDEFGIVDALSILLEDEGYRVASASDGREGLARVKDKKPDLIVMDVMMPMMNGIEMLRALRADGANDAIHVIMMSAAPEPKEASAARAAGQLSAFLRKPFPLKNLRECIHRLIGPAVPGA